jgi:hypothetical protein
MAPKGKKPGQQTDDDDPDGGGGSAFSDDQLTQLQTMIAQGTNAAVSAQLSRRLDAAIDNRITPKFDELKTILQGAAPKTEGGDGAGAAKKSEDPEVAELRRKNADYDRKFQTLDNDRKQERARAHQAERDRKLNALAATAGVDKNRVRGVVALLASDVRIDDETGAMTVKKQREGYEEDVPIEAHAAEFFKSDEGKSYLAPPNPRGPGAPQRPAGGGPGPRPPQQNNAPGGQAKDQKAQQVAQAREDLAGAISELVGGGSIDIG